MSKKPASLKVHQLAKELDVSSKDIVAWCQKEEIPDIVNHLSNVSMGLAGTLRGQFKGRASNAEVGPVKVARESAIRAPAPILGREGKTSIVPDTNALLELPRLPKLLRSDERLCMAPPVFDELDRLRAFAKPRRARMAKAAIQELGGAQYEVVPVDPRLRQLGFKDTIDNRIISTVWGLHQGGNPALLITADQVVQKKCLGLKLRWMCPAEFGRR